MKLFILCGVRVVKMAERVNIAVTLSRQELAKPN